MKERFKKNPLIFIMALEVLFLAVLLIAMGTRKNEKYVFTPESYIGNTTQQIELGFGSYEVTMKYHTDTDDNIYQFIDSTYIDNAMNGDLIGTLDSKKTMLRVPFCLYHKTDMFYVIWRDAQMDSVTIEKTNALFAEWILFFAILFLVLDFGLYRFFKSASGNPVEVKKNKVAAADFATAFVVSVPLMINYLLDSRGDISFHLARIEGIYKGLMEGRFPVRMDSFMLKGQGYADPIFYPSLFLYIPALFRIIGLPVLRAYKLFVGIWNLFTCIVAFYSFKKIAKSDKAAIIGMILYVLSPYRVLCLYGRGALGEALALTFFPLVAAGLWQLLGNEKKYKEGVILLTLGLTGVLQSHILSCEMIGIFMILALLFCAKRTFRPRTLLSLVISAVLVVALNLWFLIPFLQSYGMDLYVFNKFDVYLYENALSLYNLFGSQTDLYGQSSILTTDLRDEMGMSLGLAIMFGMMITAFGIRLVASKRKTDIGKLVPVAAILGALASWMTTYFFPWEQVETVPVIGKLLGMVQFPWRYLGVATFCFVLMIVAFLKLKEEAVEAEALSLEGEQKELLRRIAPGKTGLQIISVILVLLAVLIAYFNFHSLVDQTEFFAPYSEVGVNKGRTMIQAEYLYTDTTIVGLREAAKVPTPYTKNGSTLTFEIKEANPEAWELETPMTFYPYYIAKDMESGEILYTAKSYAGTAVIFVPGGYSGTIKFYVPESKKWLLGDLISLVTLVGICVVSFRKGKKDE